MAGTETQTAALEGKFEWTPSGGTAYEYAITDGKIGIEVDTVEGMTSKTAPWSDEKPTKKKLSALSVTMPYDTAEDPFGAGKLRIGQKGTFKGYVNDDDYWEGPARVKSINGPFYNNDGLDEYEVAFSPAGGPITFNGTDITV